MKQKSFVIEGTWSGYQSAQTRIVHRTKHKSSERKLRNFIENTYAISYTDGTCLYLKTRDLEPRERIKVIDSYSELIYDCFRKNVNSVSDLIAK